MTSRTMRFDVVMATDGRFPGGNTSSVVEEIEAQHRAGYRTGLLHLPSPVLDKPRPFAPKLRKVLEEGKAELVLGADHVEARLLLARHPTVFTDLSRDLPRLDVEHVVLAVNQVAADERGVLPYYDVPHVHRQIRRFAGKEATWAPIGPRVRQSLEEQAGLVPVLPWDWENVIDVSAWQVNRQGFVSDRPVIGRHSRGHWSKWPDTKRDLLAAYPDDPRYSVRILGGAKAPADVLDYPAPGRIPPNWVDLPFNSVPAREFLATIDFFVYFHHPGLIEAFGRVVLEALSAGAVAVVPPYLEPLFGNACLYGHPGDVRRYVDELYGDWEAFLARSRAGVELAQKRFSYETHVERLTTLIGDPSTRAVDAQPHGAVPRDGGTLVMDLCWDVSGAKAPSGVIENAAADRPCAVVAPAWRASTIAGNHGSGRRELVLETFPAAIAELPTGARRRYLAARTAELVAAHRPGIVVLVDGGVRDAPAVLDALAGSGVEVVVVRRDTITPPGSAVEYPDLARDAAWPVPEGWTALRHRPARAGAGARPRGAWTARLRRKTPMWARLSARRTMSALRRARVRLLERVAPTSGLMLFEAGEAELALPVRTPVTHPAPEKLPVALVVVTSLQVEAAPTMRAIVERAQLTTAFRVAVLAPPSWVDEAQAFGITLETLVDETSWATAYGDGWDGYLRRRVSEACRVVHPSTVVFVDRTISPAGRGAGGTSAASVVLDVLETARTRRRA